MFLIPFFRCPFELIWLIKSLQKSGWCLIIWTSHLLETILLIHLPRFPSNLPKSTFLWQFRCQSEISPNFQCKYHKSWRRRILKYHIKLTASWWITLSIQWRTKDKTRSERNHADLETDQTRSERSQTRLETDQARSERDHARSERSQAQSGEARSRKSTKASQYYTLRISRPLSWAFVGINRSRDSQLSNHPRGSQQCARKRTSRILTVMGKFSWTAENDIRVAAVRLSIDWPAKKIWKCRFCENSRRKDGSTKAG